jgi:hypothetical protein
MFVAEVKKPIYRTRPEAAIQKRIIAFLRDRGWHVKPTHGNAYQKGVPDLLCFNASFIKTEFGGYRPVDCKVEGQHKYTKAQCLEWPEWMPEAGGPGVWIMMDDTERWYKKLFEQPNMWEYWKPAYDKYRLTVDEVMEGMND